MRPILLVTAANRRSIYVNPEAIAWVSENRFTNEGSQIGLIGCEKPLEVVEETSDIMHQIDYVRLSVEVKYPT